MTRLNTLVHQFKSNQFLVALVVALLVWLLYEVRMVIALVFLSYTLAVALKPIASYLEDKNWPKTFARILPHLLIAVLFIGVFIIYTPRLLNEVGNLTESLTADSESRGLIQDAIQTGTQYIFGFIQQSVLGIAGSTLQAIISFFAFFILSIYILYFQDYFRKRFRKLTAGRLSESILSAWDDMDKGLGDWLRGQVIIALVVGTLTWLALSLAGLPFAFALGVLTGLLEFIPYIGPIIAALPAIALGFSQSFFFAAVIAGIYLGIQVAENNVIFPWIMSYSVKLNPITIIIAVLVGSQLMGVIGAVIAVPISLLGKIAIKNFLLATKTI